MRVVVPFSADDPLTRLDPVLGPDERRAFARAMLGDVLDAVAGAGAEPEVLATRPFADGPSADSLDDPGYPVTADERPLSDAVNAVLESTTTEDGGGPVAIVMADLALATPGTLRRLFAAADASAAADLDAAADADADIAIAPGRGGGTNALVVRDDAFRVDYHGASYRDHRRICEEIGADVAVVDSFRLATDVDEPVDLVEVLLHTDGRAAAWLHGAGFTVETGGGRVRARRD